MKVAGQLDSDTVADAQSGPLSALLDALGRHRAVLFGLYALLIVFCTAMVYGFGPEATGTLRHLVPGEFDELDSWGYEGGAAVIFVVVLLAIQALFLFGGGRVSIGKAGAGTWRTLIPVAVASAGLLVMLLTFVLTLFEMFDRADGEGSIRETPIFDIEVFLDPSEGLNIGLLIVWLVWIAMAVIVYRRRDHESVLRRLTSQLLAGSWIEFLIALPVDVAVRQRSDDCPCATGSWLALLVALPVMVFAFGPALFLLYLREVELGRTEPRRAVRILLHRSRRANKREPVA